MVFDLKVRLLRYTADPELVCGTAALTSSKSGTPSEIFDGMDLETARKKIRRVTGYGHVSVIEHASFTFSVEGVSRSMTHQLVRHRVASYTQQSQRYVSYDALEEYVTPPSIAQNVEAKRAYDEVLSKVSQTYRRLLELGMSKEDARFVLPNAAKTNIVVTMNARELRHFFNLRCCTRAQWEIREVATEMLRQARQVAPALFGGSGPTCVEYGYCPEGKMKPADCNIAEKKELFRNI